MDKISRELKQVNIFTTYSQKENHFTNGLISILKLISIEKKDFVKDFFQKVIPDVDFGAESIENFQVLKGYEQASTADAILIGDSVIVQVETKIVSASLRKEQIDRHIGAFDNYLKKYNYLILLTPDDSGSTYIKKHTENKDVFHVEWKHVYKLLQDYKYKSTNTILINVIGQYLDTIKNTIFDLDIVGIIAKVSFGEKSGVNADKYLEQMQKGEWKGWNTPRQYKSLDGTGRKLLLYDKNKRGITLEVEIAKVEETKQEGGFPWTNHFAEGTIRIFDQAIPVAKITQLQGFDGFVRERAPYRNITHDEYRQLTDDVPL